MSQFKSFGYCALRSGTCCLDDAKYFRAHHRCKGNNDFKYRNQGFRCVLSLTKGKELIIIK